MIYIWAAVTRSPITAVRVHRWRGILKVIFPLNLYVTSPLDLKPFLISCGKSFNRMFFFNYGIFNRSISGIQVVPQKLEIAKQ